MWNENELFIVVDSTTNLMQWVCDHQKEWEENKLIEYTSNI